MLKKCNGCEEEKDVSKFSKDRSKKDGLRTLCKDCTSERVKARHKKKPEDESFNITTIEVNGEEMPAKKCRGCLKLKPLTDYYKHDGCKGGVMSKCKACHGIKGLFTHSKIQKIEIDGELVSAKDCKTCGEILPLTDFYKINSTDNKRRVGNVESSCKSCSKEYRKELEEIDPKRRETRIKKSRLHTQLYKERRRVIDKEYRERNPEKFKVKDANRLARKRLLPNTLTEEGYLEVCDAFGNECALTDSKNTTMDHFIPLSIGHGGTYVGNVLPLDAFLNYSKQHINPFEWVEREEIVATINKGKWDNLVEYLAKNNGMSVEKYREYVYWCYSNPRTLEDLKTRSISSVDLFNERPAMAEIF